MPNKTLIIYTLSYPHGPGEQFITPELNVLAEHFKEVILIPEDPQGETISSLPQNVKTVYLPELRKPTGFVRFLYPVLSQERGISDFRYLYSLYKNNYLRSVRLAQLLAPYDSANTVHFSYWFYNWATTLSILKAKNKIHAFFARAHGFDLYDERSSRGFIPFRKLQLKQIDKVFVVSRNGTNYLQKHYPEYAFKITHLPIGTLKISALAGPKKGAERLIVSCSLLLKLKRINILARALAKIKTPIRWVHFGDGPERENIQKIAASLHANITVELRGSTDNKLIHEFYANNYINLFINVSEYEGLPVSIMEAISYGIPVLATDVGGTNEIVNKTTGKLISKTIDEDLLASEISHMLTLNFDRDSIQTFWQNNYSAKINSKRLSEELLA